MRPSLLTVAAVVALAGLTFAQEPQQKMFRSGVQTVPIYATVTDAGGRLVTDLKQEDFQVFDNGKPAPITLFVAETQPIAVVTAIDVSGSMTLVLDFVREAAEAFMLRLLPADRALIATFGDTVKMSPEFTSNRDALIRYLRSDKQYSNGTALWDAMYRSIARLKDEPLRKGSGRPRHGLCHRIENAPHHERAAGQFPARSVPEDHHAGDRRRQLRDCSEYDGTEFHLLARCRRVASSVPDRHFASAARR
jgi:hypothetical protein